MPRYYVNETEQTNSRDHEVHKEGCYWLSLINYKKDLGLHLSCDTAVIKAKETYPTADGCKTCSNECHNS